MALHSLHFSQIDDINSEKQKKMVAVRHRWEQYGINTPAKSNILRIRKTLHKIHCFSVIQHDSQF